jgi:hypothetical protein
MTEPTAPPTNTPISVSPEEQRVLELERRLSAQTQEHQARLTQSELKLHAVRAGMIDLDGIKLLDPARIKLTETGEVEAADRLMADLRHDKPWLFRQATTSSLGTAPPSTPLAAKRALEMTHAEWQAARAVLLKRR